MTLVSSPCFRYSWRPPPDMPWCWRRSSRCVRTRADVLIVQKSICNFGNSVNDVSCRQTSFYQNFRLYMSDAPSLKRFSNAAFRIFGCTCPRLPVFSRPSTIVLVRRVSARLWFPTAPSPVIRFTDVCRSTCTQHVWWPVLCYCGASGLELFAGWTAKLWLS